jgi:hypothetical protein
MGWWMMDGSRFSFEVYEGFISFSCRHDSSNALPLCHGTVK